MIKKIIALTLVATALFGCHKSAEENTEQASCNMQQVYEDNSRKATITNGVWGTVAFTEGNCMPVVSPATNSCKTCPVKRTLRIYNYTVTSQAMPQFSNGFYDSFSTQIIKEINTDEDGFFQTDLPFGKYTIVIVENGKLYANSFDGQGGISPVSVTGGKQNVNLSMTYKAVF